MSCEGRNDKATIVSIVALHKNAPFDLCGGNGWNDQYCSFSFGKSPLLTSDT